LIVIMLIPVALAIAAGFEPMKWTVTYSWGNSIITSEVKSFTVNPPSDHIFRSAGLRAFPEQPGLSRGVRGIISIYLPHFLTSFRYITGRRI
jgi:hypothetical protein